MSIRIKYVNVFRDRHGHLRYYFRRRGEPAIALPGKPGSPEFAAAYNAALAQLPVKDAGEDWAEGSIGAVITAYYGYHQFLTYAESTRGMRRRILELIRKKEGHKPLRRLDRAAIEQRLAQQKPQNAKNWLKTLRGLMEYARRKGLISTDPTSGIKIKITGGRIHTWDEAEIAQFEARHPTGSKARLAMSLLLYTGQRRSDVIRLGPRNMRGGKIFVRQKKTKMQLRDEVLEIPAHPDLARVLAASRIDNLSVFLINDWGKPFASGAAFGNKMRDWCDQAGLPQCSSHGLRKAICRRLAEAGCSAPQIAAISGHKSLAEVQRYIEAANRAKLAEDAVAKLAPPERAGNEKVTTLPLKKLQPQA
jgi:integrase